MKYIFLLLSTLLLFSCKTTYNNYSSYDEVYDTYKPTEEIISSDQVEQTYPVNIQFNVIEYDLWTYRYPYYRRSWFYNSYNYNCSYNWNYWSIYSPNYYYWHLYQPNYWNLGNSWNYYCGVYSYPYYTNYWNNNWYGNNYWYNNHYHPYHNYFINNNKPVVYGHRTVKNPTIQKPNFSKPAYDKVPVERPNPVPVEKPKKDPYIYSNPNTKPIRVESKPSKLEDTRKPVITQPNPPVRTQPNPPVRTQPNRTEQPQRVQPSQNKQPNVQRSVNTQPQKNNKPRR